MPDDADTMPKLTKQQAADRVLNIWAGCLLAIFVTAVAIVSLAFAPLPSWLESGTRIVTILLFMISFSLLMAAEFIALFMVPRFAKEGVFLWGPETLYSFANLVFCPQLLTAEGLLWRSRYGRLIAAAGVLALPQIFVFLVFLLRYAGRPS